MEKEIIDASCPNCDGTGLVCENHRDRPWDGESNREDACGCGAGAPCPVCWDQRSAGKTWDKSLAGEAIEIGRPRYGEAPAAT